MDRTVINVEAAPQCRSFCFEVLEKSPGVTVSNDGAISLKGKDGVIDMDGKQTYLSSTDLATTCAILHLRSTRSKSCPTLLQNMMLR
jgi:hypothetical protein